MFNWDGDSSTLIILHSILNMFVVQFHASNINIIPNYHFDSLTPLDTQEEPLGEGTFSTVYRCHDATSGARHAVKFTKSNEQTRRALEREVKIMRGLITKVAAQAPWLSVVYMVFVINYLRHFADRWSWSWQMKDCDAVANDPRTPKGCGVFCV